MKTDRLQTYFEEVRRHPFYQGLYDGVDRYVDALPLQKKALLDILAQRFNLQAENRGVYLVRSGGTTQAPLIFPVDIGENSHQRDLLAQALVKHGLIRPQTVGINLFTYGLIYRTASILDDVLERCGATTLPVSAEAKDADVYANIAHFRPNLIFGSPSRLAIFAQYVQENGLSVEIPDLLFGGEFMVPSYQRLFQKAFGTQNLYALYGSAETGIWAWSVYSKNPSLYRFVEGIHVEIAQPDAEGFGSVLVTNLNRRRFPVFRYDLGDIGRLIRHEGEQYLELKSRNGQSFYLDSSNVSVDDFNAITADADLFQIQLRPGENIRNELRLLLVKTLPEADKTAYLLNKVEQIKKLLYINRQLVDVRVELATPADLHMNRVTSKIPQLIDFRT